jgi:uncharacterized protein YjaG (DUF416 family)
VLNRIRTALSGQLATVQTAKRVVPLAQYDAALKTDLLTLPKQTRAAFAVACAERLYPAYEAFIEASGRGDDGLVRSTLNMAWDAAKTGLVSEPDPPQLFERVVALIPDADPDDVIPPHADDAIASAAYAFQAAAYLDDRAAGWAAERVMNALDSFILSTDSEPNEPAAEDRVWEHPLVREEINRRTDDLAELTKGADWVAVVDAIRSRSAGRSALPIEQLTDANRGPQLPA